MQHRACAGLQVATRFDQLSHLGDYPAALLLRCLCQGLFRRLRLEGVLCRRLVLPPAAVELVPNEDSWSELAKQFLRRESFLGQRGKHSSRRKKKGGQHEGAEGDPQHRRSADPGRAESWDTDDLQGASPMSSQEVCLHILAKVSAGGFT